MGGRQEDGLREGQQGHVFKAIQGFVEPVPLTFWTNDPSMVIRDDPSIRFGTITRLIRTMHCRKGPWHGEQMNHEDDDFDDFDSPCHLVLLVLSRP